MKTKLNYKSKKTVIIIAIIVALLILSGTGIYVFTKGNDDAEAYVPENTTIVDNYVKENGGQEQENIETEQTTEPNENTENDVVETTTNQTQNTTVETTNTVTQNVQIPTNSTTTRTTGNVPNEEYVVVSEEEVEKLVYEGFLVGWTPISLSAITSNLTLKKAEIQPNYTLTKVATLLNGEKINTETSKAQVGDVVTYTITLENTGNVTLQNILVTDELIKDKNGKEYESTIPVLEIGEKKEITLTYTITEADITLDANNQKIITNVVTSTVINPVNTKETIERTAEAVIGITEGVKVESTKENSDQIVTFTLTDGTCGEQELSSQIQCMLGCLSVVIANSSTSNVQDKNAIVYAPGWQNTGLVLKIVNNSGNTFKYVKNSFKLSTVNLQQYINSGEEEQVQDTNGKAVGFDGYPIAKYFTTYRVDNSAIYALYPEITFIRTVYHKQYLADEPLDERLKAKGYSGGINDLAKYYLDFYNEKYGTSATKLAELPEAALKDLFSGNNGSSIPETCKEVAELGYNRFYNKLFSLIPYKYIKESNESYESISKSGKYVFGKLMKDNILESYYNLSEMEIKDGEEITIPLKIYIDGPDTTNAYQAMIFGFNTELKLTQVVEE